MNLKFLKDYLLKCSYKSFYCFFGMILAILSNNCIILLRDFPIILLNSDQSLIGNMYFVYFIFQFFALLLTQYINYYCLSFFSTLGIVFINVFAYFLYLLSYSNINSFLYFLLIIASALSTYAFLSMNKISEKISHALELNQSVVLAIIMFISSIFCGLVNHLSSKKWFVIIFFVNSFASLIFFYIYRKMSFSECGNNELFINKFDEEYKVLFSLSDASGLLNRKMAYILLAGIIFSTIFGFHFSAFGLIQILHIFFEECYLDNIFLNYASDILCLTKFGVGFGILYSLLFSYPNFFNKYKPICVVNSLMFNVFMLYISLCMLFFKHLMLFGAFFIGFFSIALHILFFDFIKKEFALSNTFVISTIFNSTCSIGLFILNKITFFPSKYKIICYVFVCIINLMFTFLFLSIFYNISAERLLSSFFNKIFVNFKKLDKHAIMPVKSNIFASGFDIFSNEEKIIVKGKFELIGTGLSIDNPLVINDKKLNFFDFQIRSRSGLASKGIFVLNSPGTIDFDYVGEIKVILCNLSDSDFKVTKGMKIAQIIFNDIKMNIDIKDCNLDKNLNVKNMFKLKENLRGSKGFGSSGM